MCQRLDNKGINAELLCKVANSIALEAGGGVYGREHSAASRLRRRSATGVSDAGRRWSACLPLAGMIKVNGHEGRDCRGTRAAREAGLPYEGLHVETFSA
ncbi:hypothetical protein NUW54_g217 [Trametes sanguinea]|uniref:Uncharacterized protein n=1 Tax=Trametes sanguinea TaxID=158606 RepID=A0ACC1QBN8_9APHY|nr:hypothetical protein NUW54_g217 [Trametes sanguinea]